MTAPASPPDLDALEARLLDAERADLLVEHGVRFTDIKWLIAAARERDALNAHLTEVSDTYRASAEAFQRALAAERQQREQAEARVTALEARIARLQARADQLFSAASLGLGALDRHDDWCGYRSGSPGGGIRQAERALREALEPSRCLDCGTDDYSGGRAHYEDGMRCMACATVAALTAAEGERLRSERTAAYAAAHDAIRRMCAAISRAKQAQAELTRLRADVARLTQERDEALDGVMGLLPPEARRRNMPVADALEYLAAYTQEFKEHALEWMPLAARTQQAEAERDALRAVLVDVRAVVAELVAVDRRRLSRVVADIDAALSPEQEAQHGE